MRRKPGGLVPLELAICATAADLRGDGMTEFHGYEMARRLGEAGDSGDRRLLTAYGTLYRALGRLESMGLLESRWEDPDIPARENRPGRRLYTLTAAGELALAAARKAAAEQEKPARRPGRRVVPA
jgi:DNA-binding PadR family transcriptional regulator